MVRASSGSHGKGNSPALPLNNERSASMDMPNTKSAGQNGNR